MADCERTALGRIDQALVEQFWERFVIDSGLDAAGVKPEVFQFGDSAEIADQLLAMVVDGPKRATAGCRFEYADDGADLPTPGDFAVICDGRGAPAAVIRTAEVRVGPMRSVDDRFAWDEGEGDRTRDDWLRIHADFFERTLPSLWNEWGNDLPVVFERFELVFS